MYIYTHSLYINKSMLYAWVWLHRGNKSFRNEWERGIKIKETFFSLLLLLLLVPSNVKLRIWESEQWQHPIETHRQTSSCPAHRAYAWAFFFFTHDVGWGMRNPLPRVIARDSSDNEKNRLSLYIVLLSAVLTVRIIVYIQVYTLPCRQSRKGSCRYFNGLLLEFNFVKDYSDFSGSNRY